MLWCAPDYGIPLAQPVNTVRLDECRVRLATGTSQVKDEGKAIPLQAWTDPEVSRRLSFPDSKDIRHIKVVRLSALTTSRPYHTGNIPGTHFCWRLSRPQGHSAAERIMSVTPTGIEPATFQLQSPVVTVCTTSLTFNNSTFYPRSVFMCFVWI